MKLIHVIHNVLNKHNASLHESSRNSLQLLANEMYSANLIISAFQQSPSFDIIIAKFIALLSYINSVSKTYQHCGKFLSVLTKIGGPCALVSQVLKYDLIKDSRTECGVELQLGIQFNCTNKRIIVGN